MDKKITKEQLNYIVMDLTKRLNATGVCLLVQYDNETGSYTSTFKNPAELRVGLNFAIKESYDETYVGGKPRKENSRDDDEDNKGNPK